MASTVADRLNSAHPQMLRVESESDRKKLAVGRRVERALELLGITKQAAAFAMGYADSGVVSRWCTAVERPLFDKLETIDGFENAYVQALAEKNPRFEILILIRPRVA